MLKNNENIKELLSQDITQSLHDFLNDEEYEGKYEGNFTGIVVDNKDPDKVGKCKIRVFGVHGDNIQDKDLPWAFPDFSFRGGLKGSFVVPPVDCFVNVYFERGEIYIPRYSNKVIDENSMPTNKDTDYPDNMVFYETDNGDYFEINRKKKETTLKHSSETKFFMDDDIALLEHNIGSKFEIDKKKILIEHNTGHTITMDRNKVEIEDSAGNVVTLNRAGVKIKASKILDLEHGVVTKSNATAVIPTGTGCFCALPACVITGTPHTGQQAV